MYFHKTHDNTHKTEAIDDILIDNERVEFVTTFEYLGLQFDSTMSFSNHYEAMENKVNGALSKMYTLKRLMSENVIKTVIRSYVMNIIDFGLLAWFVQLSCEISILPTEITRFLLSYFHPRLYKKSNKPKGIDRRKTDYTFSLLKRCNLMTISEKEDNYNYSNLHIKIVELGDYFLIGL